MLGRFHAENSILNSTRFAHVCIFCLILLIIAYFHHVLLQTHVIFPHLVVSNVDEYFPQPEKFIPERWLKNKAEFSECPAHNRTQIHPFVSLPFGYGRRSCLGRRFAEAELNIMLAKVRGNFFVEMWMQIGFSDFQKIPSGLQLWPVDL